MKLFQNKRSLSINFNSREIKILDGKYSNKTIKIYRYWHVDIPNNVYRDGVILDLEQMIYILKNTMKENNISTKNVIGVINSSMIITREIKIPKITPEEINSMLNYQVEEYIPIDPQDYIVQFLVLDYILEEGIEKSKVLLVGIPRNIVKSHLALFNSIGLKPKVLDFQGNTIAKLIKNSSSINSNYPCINRTILSLELSYEGIALTLLDNGLIRIARTLDEGVHYMFQGVTDIYNMSSEEIIEEIESGFKIEKENIEAYEIIRNNFRRILEDIDMVSKYYINRELNNKIDLILLHGKFIDIEDIEEIFYNFFGIDAVVLKSVDSVCFNGELSKYSSAIGGLIRNNEV
ncbi:pilus assembly protein PilM [Tissierellaceae bacterium HCP3S3_D8]